MTGPRVPVEVRCKSRAIGQAQISCFRSAKVAAREHLSVGPKRRQSGALLSDEFDGRTRDPSGRTLAAFRAGIATAGLRDAAKFARQNSVGETTFANVADEIFEPRDAFADPSQFFCGNRVVRGVARIDIGLAEQLETAAREFVGARPCFD